MRRPASVAESGPMSAGRLPRDCHANRDEVANFSADFAAKIKAFGPTVTYARWTDRTAPGRGSTGKSERCVARS